MDDAQLGEVGADHVHHCRDRPGAEQVEPLAFGSSAEPVAEFGGQSLAHGNQVVARIEPFWYLAHRFAQGFAVSQMGRPGEHLHLRPGIVDVVFARHFVPGKLEQLGQCVAHHGPAAMAHMHRPGRVGRDELHVDPCACTHLRTTVVAPEVGDHAQLVEPRRVSKA